MYKFIERYFVSKDDRGVLEGLINSGEWQEVNYIQSENGVIRGNHYHKKTVEVFFILSGKLKVSLQKVVDGKLDGEIKELSISKGEVFMINPMTHHTFDIIEDSEWINMLSIKMNQETPDIHRIKI